jgi:hypothetical protein
LVDTEGTEAVLGGVEMAKTGGNQIMLLLALLGLISGAGAWNYNRNVELEAAAPRPYRSYSLEDLEALKGAYQGEADRHMNHYREASSRKVAVRGGAGLIAEQVAEFERIQRISQSKRNLASGYAKNQVQLDEILAELSQREQDGNGWQLHITRLTRYP